MTGDPTTPTAPAGDIVALARSVDEAVRKLATLDEPALSLARSLQEAVEALHHEALQRIVSRLASDQRGRVLLAELLRDPAVSTVLVLQGLVRVGDPGAPGVEIVEGAGSEPLPADPSAAVITIDLPEPPR